MPFRSAVRSVTPLGGVSGPRRSRRRRRILIIAGAVVLVAVPLYPFVGGHFAARIAARKAEEKLGVPVRIAGGRAGLGTITLKGIEVGAKAAGQAPLARVDKAVVPFNLAWGGKGTVRVSGLAVEARRGGPEDNIKPVLEALRKKRGSAAAGGGDSKSAGGSGDGRSLPGLVLEDGRIAVRDMEKGATIDIKNVRATFVPGAELELTAEKAEGASSLGPRFGVESVTISLPFDGARPRGYPTLAVTGGYLKPLERLALTGIRGKVHPPVVAAGQQPDANAPALIVDLEGSYGGARETLWTARGGLDPAAQEGQVALRAAKFALSEISDVLPSTVLSPEATTVNAAFDVSWAEGAVRFGGNLQVNGLSIHHPGLGSEPARGMDLALVVRGTAFPERRRVAIDRLEGRLHDLVGKLSGFVELAPGSFVFTDGKKINFLPRMELTLEVPKLPCAKAIASLPPPLVPSMQGFTVKGDFGAEIRTRIDYADLEALDLTGKVAIDGCQVLKPPPALKAVLSGESIEHTVEVPPTPATVAKTGRAEPEEMKFIVGPENPDFVQYENISPYLIASIMTTEDNGFFKHRGWLSSEFKNALRKNLQRGGFRGGASTITMQMVKNVLLSHEKTLSRKLQELFLVWYLEQEIPKERILELYFNAIEFGPRIYGIGRAAHHYFGKSAADLTPLEGAFFSSILPSPKRRYVQFCHGSLLPQWDKYVRRILAKVYERGRISEEEHAAMAEEKLVFQPREPGFTEKQCLDWVKKITARPDPEVPPDVDVPLDGDDVADAGGKGGKNKGGKHQRRRPGKGAGVDARPKGVKTAAAAPAE